MKSAHAFLVRMQASLLSAALLTCGCSSPIDSLKAMRWLKGDDSAKAKAAAGPVIVKVDSFGKPLREGQEVTISREDFLGRADKLLVDERLASLRHWVERYPDIALEVLRTTQNGELKRASIRAIADAYDRQMGLTADGWRQVIDDRLRKPEAYKVFDAQRRDVLEKIRLGQLREAAATKLTATAEALSSTMLMIDAWQLQSVALTLDDRAEESAAALERALKYAAASDPYQTAQLTLLLSDVQRRIGQAQQAADTWRRAIERGSALVGRQPSVIDPVFWDRASYLRPVDMPWPDAVATAVVGRAEQGDILLVSATSPTETAAQMESLLWKLVGSAHLDRNENQSALVALKHAETCAVSETAKARLRLDQATALNRLQQPTAAVAILVALSSHSDRSVACAALARLGTQKLQSDEVMTGYKLLAKAFEKNEAVDWPGRAEAEADYGLACLMCNEEQQGLRWLHQAQDRFDAAKDFDSLVKSLSNEAAYFEHTKKRKEAAAIKERLKTLERT
ncbi:MAG TPA: hypothetical protein VG713_03485 [Pirellulales bacterium]|nr:hypothetical protein [Pirellulales bacterium]